MAGGYGELIYIKLHCMTILCADYLTPQTINGNGVENTEWARECRPVECKPSELNVVNLILVEDRVFSACHGFRAVQILRVYNRWPLCRGSQEPNRRNE